MQAYCDMENHEYVSDRLSAAREGVVKALGALVDGWPDNITDPAVEEWIAIRVTLSASNYLAARAALKELEEAEAD